MKAIIPVRDILPNPFQHRRKINKESVQMLAEEIKEVGLWPGALRGRMKGSKVELCYGHRRLQALKILGYKEIEIDVLDLTDNDMAMQSLAENFQREGLTDIEKAEGIKMMLDRQMRSGVKESEAIQKASRIVGLSPAWIRDLLSLLTLEPTVQRAIRDRDIAGRTALEAHRLGGRKMVESAIRHKIPVHKISAMAQRLRQIPDEGVQKKLRSDVLNGRLASPEMVEDKARKMLKGKKINAPANLYQIVSDWQVLLHHWNDKMEELLVFKKFLPAAAGYAQIKSEAAAMMKKLGKLS